MRCAIRLEHTQLHDAAYDILCYAVVLLACLLAAAVVSVSTDLLQEHNVTAVPHGPSVTE